MKWHVLTLAMVLSTTTSCSYINQKLGMQDDSIPEELIEGILEKETGVSVDLTPQTVERVK